MSDIMQTAKEMFGKIQSQIYGDVQVLLKYAKLNPIEILKDKNPSYSESAAILSSYVSIIRAIADAGVPIPRKEIHSLERIVTAFTSLALAIDEEDFDGMGAAIASLDCEPYI